MLNIAYWFKKLESKGGVTIQRTPKHDISIHGGCRVFKSFCNDPLLVLQASALLNKSNIATNAQKCKLSRDYNNPHRAMNAQLKLTSIYFSAQIMFNISSISR